MPELPEVETYARQLRANLIGRTIVKVQVFWERTIATGANEFSDRLAGRQFVDVGRRGKYLVFSLSGGDRLLCHLKMSGRLRIDPSERSPEPHDRVVFTLDDGHDLRFNDTRKFGRMHLVQETEDRVTVPLGPEPLSLDFSLDHFRERLARHSGALKPLLTNQAFIAGIGNIYADEALFRARLHPLRKVGNLTPSETEALYCAIRDILQQSIDCHGTSFDFLYTGGMREGSAVYQSFLSVYGRSGEPCPRCGSPIVRIVVGARGTHICPSCQSLNGDRRLAGSDPQGD